MHHPFSRVGVLPGQWEAKPAGITVPSHGVLSHCGATAALCLSIHLSAWGLQAGQGQHFAPLCCLGHVSVVLLVTTGNFTLLHSNKHPCNSTSEHCKTRVT